MISAKMVKELRDKTGAGMVDCQKALKAANGDVELAIENLRKAGIAKAEKKSGRAATQGKVWTSISDKDAAIVELLIETDFAAKTPKFSDFVQVVANDARELDAEGDVTAQINEKDAAAITNNIAIIGENMQLRRAIRWTTDGSSKFAGYHHMDGRVSVLVEVEGEDDAETLNDICLHVAAFNPPYIQPSDIPAEVIQKEKEIAAAADPKLAGKSAEMLEKILAGKINRYYSEKCLMNQPWIRDDKTTLAKIKPNLKVKRIVRWSVGEEI